MDEKRANEALAALMASKDPQARQALAELIVEFVQPNHLANQFVSDILDTRALKPGDALVKKTRSNVPVYTLVPGSIPLASEITVEERINFVLDISGVKVTYNEWELEGGEIGTLQEIRNTMAANLRDSFVNRVFNAIATVWTAGNTPDNFTSVGGAITATVLEDAIDRINLVSAGAKVVIGSRTAVTPITKFGAFWSDGANVEGSQNAIDEIREKGFLGKYYGVPVITVEQVFDNLTDYNPLVPNDFILVVGESAGEFITYGDVRTKQWNDMNPTPPQWFLELYQQWGLILDFANRVYVIGGLS